MQAAALASLKRVVDEGFTFGAVTGARNSGKSAILTELLKVSQSACRVCVDIRAPQQMSGQTAEALHEAIENAVCQSQNRNMRVLIAVDNAHAASRDLLLLLDRFARSRSLVGSPQVVFAGEPEFWNRLGSRYYGQLLRRIALRFSLEDRAPANM